MSVVSYYLKLTIQIFLYKFRRKTKNRSRLNTNCSKMTNCIILAAHLKLIITSNVSRES